MFRGGRKRGVQGKISNLLLDGPSTSEYRRLRELLENEPDMPKGTPSKAQRLLGGTCSGDIATKAQRLLGKSNTEQPADGRHLKQRDSEEELLEDYSSSGGSDTEESNSDISCHSEQTSLANSTSCSPEQYLIDLTGTLDIDMPTIFVLAPGQDTIKPEAASKSVAAAMMEVQEDLCVVTTSDTVQQNLHKTDMTQTKQNPEAGSSTCSTPSATSLSPTAVTVYTEEPEPIPPLTNINRQTPEEDTVRHADTQSLLRANDRQPHLVVENEDSGNTGQHVKRTKTRVTKVKATKSSDTVEDLPPEGKTVPICVLEHRKPIMPAKSCFKCNNDSLHQPVKRNSLKRRRKTRVCWWPIVQVEYFYQDTYELIHKHPCRRPLTMPEPARKNRI